MKITIDYQEYELTGSNYWFLQNQWLLWIMSSRNTYVFGPQGSGKDTLIAHFLEILNGLHYSNIRYNENTVVTKIKAFGAGDNTFSDLINDTLTPYESPFVAGTTLICSDAGAYFPSSEYKKLDEMYPSMPMWLAFLRQIGHNFICNSQAYGRLWVKIREQMDYFIRLLAPVFIKDYIIVNAISYDRAESAEAGYLPTYKEEDAVSRGLIEYHSFLVPTSELQFDSTYFRKKLIKEKK